MCCFFAQGTAFAQTLSISGKVIDEQKLPMPSATVFLGGTMKITPTDVDGKFSFQGLSAGSYIITVKMIGYTPYFQNVTIKESMADMTIEMKPNPTALREVVIKATDKDWDAKYKLFKECFLGLTKNGRNCKIANPEVLRLNYDEDDRSMLKGSSDDFLIVDNPELGYRVKYLLKFFEYNGRVGVTNYDGETSFEDMSGTAVQKKKWRENRLKAYYGSSTHFFRTIFNNKRTAVNEGFLVRQLIGRYQSSNADFNSRMRPPVSINPRAVRFDTILRVIDTSFISLKFTPDLFIKYSAKGGALNMLSIDEGGQSGEVDMTDDCSVLRLPEGEAIIDNRGKVAGEMPFLMIGKWGRMRIGDQLPFEYRPDKPGK
ncbi:carboxypeptidase-like regulatory domain-containing protein [Mucilaginibacter myungsuensis]|uniref:Carboxypeptidase-like regulatory domain-containing protein n=1 Tax=Mucilaginibacter myungsuensis TaxID=649104 RepID=A0A929PYL2_9SPHI|nr:carboxypeptidase-like regulatory domain-containing protein [Mucilaginibacter myungsuensis]MBE9663442.1 carboxypeptidase-like regulatory domain-containing protein [Mucilaginibacter myungsuensis]MDN3600180.1 carboxypeptidase-like regulatory domain-containing protein [Mucilaginibacter myungsuensis]